MRKSARALLCIALSVLCASSFADEAQDRRASAGIRLFRALLAADVDLEKKTVGPKQILIVFYYVDDQRRAADLASRFVRDAKEGDRIHGLTVVTEVTKDPAFAAYAHRVPAGIFIAEPATRTARASIVQFSVQHSVIACSPYEGDVENGVLGGVSVEAQVRPYVNRSTLQASQITLRPFFLSVAKVYE